MKHENILLKSALALAIVDLVLIAAILLQVNGLVKDVIELQDKQMEIGVMREKLEKAEMIKEQEQIETRPEEKEEVMQKEIPLTGEQFFDQDLGVSFIVPGGFTIKKNKSYLGFDYLNIVYPKTNGSSRVNIENALVCPFGGCAVIRHGSSLFPHLEVKSNADVKAYIESHKKVSEYDESFIVKEWEKDEIKYLQIYSSKYRFQDILFLESKTPANFIAVLIPSRRAYQKFEDPKDINYVKTIELVNTIKIIGPSTYKNPSNPTVIYKNQKLGIQFSHPSDWGTVEDSAERCQYGEQEKIINADLCEHVDLFFTDLSWPVNLLSSYSVLFSQRGADRGGYWGDQAGKITSENFVTNYCNDKDKTKCKVYKNANNVLIARSIEEACTEGGCAGEAIMYYVKSSHPVFFGIIISTDRFRNVAIQKLEQKMDNLVYSLKFLQ